MTNIQTSITRLAELAEYYGEGSDDEDTHSGFKGWVRVPWSGPTGLSLQEVNEQLKERN